MDINYISQAVFNDYLNCHYKVFLSAKDRISTKPEYVKAEEHLKKEYTKIAFEKLSNKYPNDKIIYSPNSLEKKLIKKFSVICNTHASIDRLICNVDCIGIIKRQSIYMCIPNKFLYNENIVKNDKLSFAFVAYTISKKIGSQIKYGRIVHGDNYISTKVNFGKLFPLVGETISCIDAIVNNKSEPKFYLNSHCNICEFKNHCHKIALKNDDLSLLKGLNKKAINKSNKKGIFSVTQLSYTFRPRKQRRKKAKTILSFNASLQSLAIRNDKIYIMQRPSLSDIRPLIYLDIEGIPEHDFYYLIGLCVDYGKIQKSYSFWANTVAEERNVWDSLLAKFKKFKRFTIAHYGNYDIKALKIMRNRYGGNEVLMEKLFSSTLNVLSMIYGNIYFPVYSNDLKSISNCVGFKWSTENPSGLQAILWRRKWEIRHNQSYKKMIIKYNKEDCLALQHVMEVITKICKKKEYLSIDDMKHVEEINYSADNAWPHIYKRNEFFTKSFNRINSCAYFDYQVEKIYVRTNPSIKKCIDRGKRKIWRKIG